MHDLRLAVRGLLKTPVITAVAVVSLAFGIGANSAVFTVVNGLFLRPLPVADPGSLVSISSDFAIARGFSAGVGWSYPMWRRLRERMDLFGGGLAWSSASVRLGHGDGQVVSALFVDGGFFETLGVRARYGRTITRDDDVEGAADRRAAVISHRLWERQFGSQPAVVGQPIVVEGTTFTITGVTPPAFVGLVAGQGFDVAIPITAGPLVRGGPSLTSDRALLLMPILRLRANQSLEGATSALRALQADILGVTPDRLATVSPAFLREPFVLTPMPTGVSDRGARGQFQQPLVVLSIVMALVLLVGSLNLASVALSRAAARRLEMSVRVALGAPRWRLARGVLVESALVAGAATLGGLIVAAWGSAALVAHLSNANPGLFLDLPFDWRVLAFTVAVGFITTAVCGAIPAFRAAGSTPDLIRGQQLTSRQAGGAASPFVFVQVALSLVLVASTGLFARTFQRLADAPLGFDPARVLILEVHTGRTGVTADTRGDLYGRLLDQLTSTPGVAAVAASSMTPLGPAEQSALYDDLSRVPEYAITPEWFSVYGVRVLSGRDFNASDVRGDAPVAIVNQSYVTKYFERRNPIGQLEIDTRSSRPGAVGSRTIVGVVPNAAFGSVRKGVRPLIYLPLAQTEFARDTGAIRVNVRSVGADPGALTRSLAAAAASVDPNLAVIPRRLADDVSMSMGSERSLAALSSMFGALALLLAGLGVYGVTAAAVGARRREMAIRMALGMLPSEGVRLVLMRVGAVIAGGIAAGLVAGLWLTRFIAALLYGLDPRDAVTFGGAAIVLAIAGLVAAWIPARRTAPVNPATLLREG